MARFIENEGCSLFRVYRTLHIKAHPLQLAPILGSIIFYSRKDGISLVIQVNASALPSKSPIYAAHARKIAAGSTVCIGALPVSHTSQPATCDILQVSPLARLIGDWQSTRLPQGRYAHPPLLNGLLSAIGGIMLSNLLDCPQMPIFANDTIRR